MSDFKIKVTADLDTSQVEAKLMTLQNRKITIQANANGNGLSNMNNSLQQIQNNANSGLCAQVRASSLAGEMPASNGSC